MTKISIRHFGPLRTHDARVDDAAAVIRIIAGIKNSLGILDPSDVARIESTLQKYVGGSGTSNRMGITSNDDARDAALKLAARTRAEIANTAAVARGFREFWDKKNSELRRFGGR